MELWATYSIQVNGMHIDVVARNLEDAKEKAREKYNKRVNK